ncbi:MAG: hypothetical protein HQK96_11545 [Nitrospirae bacterium]|nr:hypothetical protein [Nitrospirota bacterium]
MSGKDVAVIFFMLGFLLFVGIFCVIWVRLRKKWTIPQKNKELAEKQEYLHRGVGILPGFIEIVNIREFQSTHYYSSGTSAGSYIAPSVAVQIANRDGNFHNVTVIIHKKNGDIITDTNEIRFNIPPNSVMEQETTFHAESLKIKLGVWYIVGYTVDNFFYSIEPIVLETKTPLGSHCFVTTAAYDDPHHPIVASFRSLRDEVLVNYKVGQDFIEWYNRNGPRLAATMEQRPQLRAVARAILTPLATIVTAVRAAMEHFPRSKNKIDE